MTTERIIRIFAGSVILISTALGLLHSHWWFVITLLVGANLLQFGITQFCPLEIILKKMGYQCNCSGSPDNQCSTKK